MSATVKYKDTTLVTIDTDTTKTLKTKGKYLEDDITVENKQDGGVTPTGTISITENGTYDVTEYASAEVDVPAGNPYEKMNEYITGTISYFKTKAEGQAPFNPTSMNDNDRIRNLRYFSMPNLIGNIYNGAFGKFGNHRNGYLSFTAIMGKPSWLQNDLFHNTKIYTLIFTNSSVPTLSGTLANVNITALKIYVRDSILQNWKSSSNWSTYADVTFGYSEAPEYNNETTYEISNVCKYNGRFYSYAKEDLTSSTGNAPTGTTEDNAYWEYIADLEV